MVGKKAKHKQKWSVKTPTRNNQKKCTYFTTVNLLPMFASLVEIM